jgi:flavorubredoxin
MQKPYCVADDIFVLPMHVPIPGHGFAYLSAMVIRGKEPVLVETGSVVHRTEYLDAAFSLVEPKDVRWIFLSHDDRDHSGNLMQVLESCPNATLVTTFVAVGRMTEYKLPPNRMRWVNDGESWSIGDRTLAAIAPPLFDGPGTRGLWDAKSGVYYSADCFGSLVSSECEEIGDIPRESWEHGFAFFNRVNHSWHQFADMTKLEQVVERLRRLEPRTLVTAHGPYARGRSKELFQRIVEVAKMEPVELPGQKDLEAILAGPRPVQQAHADHER